MSQNFVTDLFKFRIYVPSNTPHDVSVAFDGTTGRIDINAITLVTGDKISTYTGQKTSKQAALHLKANGLLFGDPAIMYYDKDGKRRTFVQSKDSVAMADPYTALRFYTWLSCLENDERILSQCQQVLYGWLRDSHDKTSIEMSRKTSFLENVNSFVKDYRPRKSVFDIWPLKMHNNIISLHYPSLIQVAAKPTSKVKTGVPAIPVKPDEINTPTVTQPTAALVTCKADVVADNASANNYNAIVQCMLLIGKALTKVLASIDRSQNQLTAVASKVERLHDAFDREQDGRTSLREEVHKMYDCVTAFGTSLRQNTEDVLANNKRVDEISTELKRLDTNIQNLNKAELTAISRIDDVLHSLEDRIAAIQMVNNPLMAASLPSDIRDGNKQTVGVDTMDDNSVIPSGTTQDSWSGNNEG